MRNDPTTKSPTLRDVRAKRVKFTQANATPEPVSLKSPAESQSRRFGTKIANLLCMGLVAGAAEPPPEPGGGEPGSDPGVPSASGFD